MKWIWFFPLFMMGCSDLPSLSTLFSQQKAIKSIKDGNFTTAQNHILDSLQEDPLLYESHLNLGYVKDVPQLQQKNKELVDQQELLLALSSYQLAEKQARNSFQKFVSLFNQAQLQGRLKKIDEALGLYQRALEIVPTSKEVKTNIELLLQSQQGQGQGQDQNQDQKDQKENKDENKDSKNKSGDEDKEKDQKGEKKAQSSPKYKPREFKGELSPTDVKKILGELKQQEQKIRAEFNKKNEFKEKPRDKDW